jgi:hypothetical protein
MTTATRETAIKIARALRKQHGYRETHEALGLDAETLELEPLDTEPAPTWHAPKPVKEVTWPSA